MTSEFDRELTVQSAVGSELWVATVGEGPALVLCDGLGCDGFIWKYIIEEFARDHTVVRWHYRGHGNSPVPKKYEDMNIPGLAEDLFLVLDALGIERASLAGHSMGVQVILEAAVMDAASGADRIESLVGLCGVAGRPLYTFKNSTVGTQVLPGVEWIVDRVPAVINSAWERVLLSRAAEFVAYFVEANPALVNAADMTPYMERLSRMDPRAFIKMLKHANEHNAVPQLHTVACPTLIVAAERDTFTPVRLSEEMTQEIPDAELFVLPDATHVGPLEWPDLLNLRWRKFLRTHVAHAAR